MKPPEMDERTRDYIRRWHKSEIPYAQITGELVTPGIYRGVPCLAWMEKQGNLVICGTHFVLMQNMADKPISTLTIAMPVTKNTELVVNTFLHLLGWDGRIWPLDGDGGWPEKSDEEEALRTMLTKVRTRTSATFTFPPSEKGATCLNLPVRSRNKPYALAPFEPVPEDDPPPIRHIDRFRQLVKDPSVFAPVN